MQRSILALLIICSFLHSAIANPQGPNIEAPLYGFSSQHAQTEREWENKFRALPRMDSGEVQRMGTQRTN